MPSIQVHQETIKQRSGCKCKSSDCSNKRCGCVKNDSYCSSLCGCNKTLCKNQESNTKETDAKARLGVSKVSSKTSRKYKSEEVRSDLLNIKDGVNRDKSLDKNRPKAFKKLFTKFDETVDLGSGDESQHELVSNPNALDEPKSSARKGSDVASQSDIK
ncbi:hypothetical protein QAD02_009009 [Eretmocerus hayati]|uniref:Uncharacterized protein n=1 Tax=Eretmocerus hayati TaxID=131215 RepID=A0ACC2NAI9_9HYME|nr:hypothetical protein QAD02_009009 [Eretmocerus hayati]